MVATTRTKKKNQLIKKATFEINSRVQHINPEIINRLTGEPRCGTVTKNEISHPWDCSPGIVEVIWDDVIHEGLIVKHPTKSEHYYTVTKGEPTRIPVSLLKPSNTLASVAQPITSSVVAPPIALADLSETDPEDSLLQFQLQL